jgi:1,4-alpha-glucan branching enzyme
MKEKLIVSDPAVMAGQPVIAGTRVTVDEILERLARGEATEEIIEAHPSLSHEGIQAALRFAAETVRAASPVPRERLLDLIGPHLVVGEEESAIAIRAFVPEAESVSIHRLDMDNEAQDLKPEKEAAHFEASGSPPGINDVENTFSAGEWLDMIRPGGDHGPAFPPGESQSQAAPAIQQTPGLEQSPETDPLLPEALSRPLPVPMQRIHPEGLYEVVFEGETDFFPYQLGVTLPRGEAYLAHDPYSFPPFIKDPDLHLMQVAENSAVDLHRLYAVLGAHLVEHEGIRGVSFAVWAPNARSVSVIGDFNQWDGRRHPMRPRENSGLWELFVPGLPMGAPYKYEILSGIGAVTARSDPFGFASELRPSTASIVWDLGRYAWSDADWMAGRHNRQRRDAPIAIYEVHLGSWRQKASGEPPHERWLGYRELAQELIPYAAGMGYTHIEILPLTEHPLDASWGYQVTGYFSPTSRYGTPDDFRCFVDAAHQAGLGVIMDWVPSHFPRDEHGLSLFDGTPLFEHPDPRRSHQADWGTLSFDLERPEVRAFLLANALFWLDQYHIDGLRLDAVSSMLYLDYSREPGQWLPNEAGGRENLQAINFFRRFNEMVHREFPDVLTFAEEASAWPAVTGSTDTGGLGFDFKWNMGWMHDTLRYFREDPIYRRHHHKHLTFSLTYAFSERYTLPFSHDEVVHGKSAMLSKMSGDYWQKFANLRALYGYMYGHPGKKLLFMGGEFGQWNEWDCRKALDWILLDYDSHEQLREFVKALNCLYAAEPALYELDFGWEGFQWIDCNDADQSILTFIRRSRNPNDFLVVAANFTPVVRKDYLLGVPAGGPYREILNSDASVFGGSDVVNTGELLPATGDRHGQPFTLKLTLPPLAVVFLKPV